MTILSLFPNDLKLFLCEIEKAGALLCLVGGGARDFLMSGVLSNDLDFEVRNIEIGILKKKFKDKGVAFDELPYDIIRVSYKGFDLEFSCPRLENPILDNKSHHHFEAILDCHLSYDRAFARRDFTLNAIGFEFSFLKDTEKMIDPFSGAEDLKKNHLREINDDFFLDSVRFLRLVRFHVKYSFSISESIDNKMGMFDLSELSIHHFKEEMRKSVRAGEFINVFNRLVSEYQLRIPVDFYFFKAHHFNSDVKNAEDVLVSVFFKSEQDAQKVSAFFSMPQSKLRDLKSFHASYNSISLLKMTDLKVLSQKSMNDEETLSLLRDLKNLEEKKEWRDHYPNHLLISWDDWESVKVSGDEIENTPAPLRSFVKYYKALKSVVS